MAGDPALAPHTTYELRTVAGTDVAWHQAAHILPRDTAVRSFMASLVVDYEDFVDRLSQSCAHIPSRTRSLLWIAAAIPILEAAGESMPSLQGLLEMLKVPSRPSRDGKVTRSTESFAPLTA